MGYCSNIPHPCQREGCGHVACDHNTSNEHACDVNGCTCEAFVFLPGTSASDFVGGGGSSGGGGATVGW